MSGWASVRRTPRLSLAGLLAYSLFGCSSSGSTKPEQHTFDDEAGRACRATLEKTSPTGPVERERVSCDSAARQCSRESTPCFELSIDTESYQIRNCPACCKGSASSFALADCAAVLCTTDSDCIYAQAKCDAGTCTCPQGYCD